MGLQGFVGSEYTVFIKIIFVQLEASVMWTERRERRLFVLLCTLSNLTQKHDQGVLQTRSSLPGNSINPTAPPPFSWAVWLQQERGAGRYGFLVVLNRACSRFKGEEPAGAIRHIKVGAKYLQSHSAAVAHLSPACPHSSLPSAAPALEEHTKGAHVFHRFHVLCKRSPRRCHLCSPAEADQLPEDPKSAAKKYAGLHCGALVCPVSGNLV